MKNTIMKRMTLLASFFLFGIAFLTGCGNKKIDVEEVTLSDSPSEIYVSAVDNLSDDFYLGVDISSLLSEEKSGVVYYNNEGEEQDLLKTMAENGVNSVRIRVWVDPFDADGNSYGGGANDLATAITLGERATKYGMSVVIDFHYSDFWADPAKQMVPKAWEGMDIDTKSNALYEYTKDAMKQLLDAGINVTMVQVGNETTTGMSGETSWKAVSTLMNAGSKAIREAASTYEKEILVAVHFTNPENADQYTKYAQVLRKYSVDYDVFASSYYPYWHGTLDNLTSVLSGIAETYDKKVMVAEISWAYTFDDSDYFGNSIASDSLVALPYAVTVQGQANCIRDTVAAISDIEDAGIGVFYWEPAWIAVPGGSYEENNKLWEANGSGWASSHSAEYDPEDAGKWYGGSSWDNQALFDSTGHPLASLSVFRFLKTGASAELAIDYVNPCTATIRLEDECILPDAINVTYNDGSLGELPATWNEDEISLIDTTVLGSYTVNGSYVMNGEAFDTTCTVNVVEQNYVTNPSFEDDDLSMWTFENIGDVTTELYVIDKITDAVTGTKSLHYYSTSADGIEFKAEQVLTDVKPGNYHFSITLHGGDCKNQQMYIYAIADGVTYTCDTEVDGWSSYHTPEITDIISTDGTITVGAYIKADSGGWGNLDDFMLAPKN